MRPFIGLVCCCALVGLTAASSSATVDISGAEQARRTFRVPSPKAGHVTVALIILRAQTKRGKLVKPRWGPIAKGLPKDVTVLGGLRLHPKMKRTWIGSVVLFRPYGPTPSSVGPNPLLFSLTGDLRPIDLRNDCDAADITTSPVDDPLTLVIPPGCQSFSPTTKFDTALIERLCLGFPSAQVPMEYLAHEVEEPPTKIGKAALDAGCKRKGWRAAEEYLAAVLGSPDRVPVPPSVPALSCSAQLHPFGPSEIQGMLTCNQDIGGFRFTPGGNPDVWAWLPATGTCPDGKTVHFIQQIPANTPFSFNVRTVPPPGPGGQLTILGLDGNDVLTIVPTGP